MYSVKVTLTDCNMEATLSSNDPWAIIEIYNNQIPNLIIFDKDDMAKVFEAIKQNSTKPKTFGEVMHSELKVIGGVYAK